VLEMDGKQVQLQFWLCSANHGIHYMTFTTKVTRT